MGFGVDVVGYSARSTTAKLDAQARVVALVNGILAANGVDPAEADRQDTGDGAIVFLPASVDLRHALSGLTKAAVEWLAEDNHRYQDRLRVRLSAVIGPVGVVPTGFVGNTVVECARLLDSELLRRAVAAHPEADLALLVSDQLYAYVIAEGYSELAPTEFESVDVQTKDFHRPAWLWLPPGRGQAVQPPVERATPRGLSIGARPRIFISHISADRAWAYWLHELLTRAGYDVKIQGWRIQAEVDLIFRAQESLSEHDCVILLVSHSYVASPYAAEEWTNTLFDSGTGTRLVVQVSPCDLPPTLAGRIDVEIADQDAAGAGLAVIDGLELRGLHRDARGEQINLESFAHRYPGLGPKVSNLPPRNLAFTGRLLALEEIHRYFLDSRAGVCGRAIYGLGGVGKSQLALEYGHRYAGDYDIIWWVGAANEATLVPDLLSLARSLDVPETNDQSQMISSLWRELAAGPRYLIIFDNAHTAFELQRYWPRSGDGHVIVTSRSRVWHTLAPGSQLLPVLGREESITFLRIRTNSRDEDAAARVAERLGYLPLALEQAAAYVDETGTNFADYDQLLQHREREVLAHGNPAGYEHTLATTWSMSIQQAEKTAAGAAALLTLFSFLAPDDIPRSLLPHHCPPSSASLHVLATDTIKYDLAVGALVRYSLVQAGGDVLHLHPLVQATVRQSLALSEERAWVETALTVLETAFPVDFDSGENDTECDHLLPHVLAAVEHAERLGINSDRASALLRLGGNYLHRKGELVRARRLLDQALAIRQEYHKDDSLEVAESLMDLVRLAYHASENSELLQARQRGLRAVRLHQALLGPEHPVVADDLTHLGAILRALGQFDEAKELTQRALRIRLDSFGAESIQVAESHHYLGYVHLVSGQIRRAEESLRNALDLRTRLLGGNHHSVGETQKLLGSVQRTLGDFAGARATLTSAVRVLAEAAGVDNIDTVAAENELADVCRELKMLDQAAELFEHVLSVRQARHGDHPYVAGTLVRWSLLLRDQGNLAEAEEAVRRGARMYEETWGPDSPFYADALTKLGAILYQAEQVAEASETLERAVRLCERNCGDHPFLADALSAMAVVRRDAGDNERAEELEQRMNAIRRVCFGPLD
jgi:tetratricopeptide (TPR) repeat protein